MGKYKYQFLALLAAIIIGAAIGIAFSSNNKNKEIKKLVDNHKKELVRANEVSKKTIIALDQKLVQLDSATKQDSVIILSLRSQIQKNELKTAQRLKAVSKLNANEKVNWIIDRYNTNNK